MPVEAGKGPSFSKKISYVDIDFYNRVVSLLYSVVIGTEPFANFLDFFTSFLCLIILIIWLGQDLSCLFSNFDIEELAA